MHKYFISYHFQTHTGTTGYGNMETHISSAINGISDINAIQDNILRDKKEFKHVVILNYVLLSV